MRYVSNYNVTTIRSHVYDHNTTKLQLPVPFTVVPFQENNSKYDCSVTHLQLLHSSNE
jgi:hypothetical protein